MNDREKDDQQTGRILTRREVFSVLSVAGVGMFGAVGSAGPNSQPPWCIGRPEQTEGPYFLDTKLNRSDIRSEPSDGSVVQGTPLILTFKVSQISAGGCLPLGGAVVDVWHCDAYGLYSGVQDPYFNTKGKNFLRGYQVTDSNGIARFTTIYPGWYPGRTVHMHFKIRINPAIRSGYEFTSQLYFDDTVTDRVYKQNPYAGRGRRRVRNQDDGLFRSGGDQLMLELKQEESGYSATFEIGLERT